MARFKFFLYGLFLLVFLQEASALVPGLYEPTLECSKEISEGREEFVTPSHRKVKQADNKIIRRSAPLTDQVDSRTSYSLTRSLPDRTILYRKLLI